MWSFVKLAFDLSNITKEKNSCNVDICSNLIFMEFGGPLHEMCISERFARL